MDRHGRYGSLYLCIIAQLVVNMILGSACRSLTALVYLVYLDEAEMLTPPVIAQAAKLVSTHRQCSARIVRDDDVVHRRARSRDRSGQRGE